MGLIEIDWNNVFCNSSSPDRRDGNCLGYPWSAPHAAATRAGPVAAMRARAGAGPGAEGVARASSDDEQPPRPGLLQVGFRARRIDLNRHVGERRPGAQVDGKARTPVTRAAEKAAADPGLEALSAAENTRSFNEEDEQGDRVACKHCLKSSPVLVRRKMNHEQANGDPKRIARSATKNDDKEPAPPEEIFEALREIIPSLDRADLLRAYSMLIRDDRLFRSLMVLPEDMRKDWLLMEIGNQ